MKVRLSVLVIMFGMLAGVARADGINVVNASFADTSSMTYSCGGSCTWNSGPIPGWTITGSGGSYEPGGTTYSSLPGDSVTVAWSNGGTISQTLSGVSLQPDSTYTYSVYVGQRSDNLVADYSISLDAGTTVLTTLTGSNGSIAPGTFALETLTYTTGNTVALGDLGIVLGSDGTQIDFADDSLASSTSAPEPGSLVMFGSGLLGLAGILRRKLFT
jgi:hypothetical protein